MFGHEATGDGPDTSSVHEDDRGLHPPSSSATWEAASGADPWCPEHLDTFLNSLNSPGAPASVQPPSVPAEVHKTDPGLLPSADPVLTPSSPRGDGEPPPAVPGAQPDLAPPCSLVQQQPRVDNSARCRQYRQRARARRADLERELHQLSTRNVHLQMKHEQQKTKVEKLRNMIKTYLGPGTPISGLMETILLELLGL